MTARFNLPIDISRLENDRLKLVPLEDNLLEWATLWVDDANAHPSNYAYLTYGPFADGAACVSWYETTMRPSNTMILFAILLKPGTVTRKDVDASASASAGTPTSTTTTFPVPANTFAGLTGLSGQPDRATADLGQMLLTQFQRTFVGTHANALLLRNLLDAPSAGGLGLRRVQWQCNASNEASVRAAQRLGFRLEGIIRWQQVLPVGKSGPEGAEVEGEGREGTPRAAAGAAAAWDQERRRWGPGRHTAMLSLCWDDWVGGGREHVDGLVSR